MVNFNWWVNRKDPSGKNIFGGGFLGLDNIGVFDRSAPLPTGGHLEQADGTAWMAFFSQCMLQIAVELATHDPVYKPMVLTFSKQFVSIASAMDHMGEESASMWDEEDGFYYDILQLPDGTSTRLKVRSLVGLLPICAATVFHGEVQKNPGDSPKNGQPLGKTPANGDIRVYRIGADGWRGWHSAARLDDGGDTAGCYRGCWTSRSF